MDSIHPPNGLLNTDQMGKSRASDWSLCHRLLKSYGGHTFSSQIVLLSSLISCFAMGTPVLSFFCFVLLLFSEWMKKIFTWHILRHTIKPTLWTQYQFISSLNIPKGNDSNKHLVIGKSSTTQFMFRRSRILEPSLENPKERKHPLLDTLKQIRTY